MSKECRKPPFFYGYTIIAASFFIQAIAWGISNSFGVFFAPLLNEFGWTRATISGAASLCFLMYGCASILMGTLNDRYGPRLIMTGCGLVLGVGFLLMSGIHTIWHLYLFYGLIVGVGLSGTDVVLLSTMARWFEKKRGMMSGVIKVGTGVGMLIMPVFITWLLKGYGWRTTFTVLGVIILGAVIFSAQFLVRNPALKAQFMDNKKPHTQSSKNKIEAGLTFHKAISTRQFKIVCAVYFIILFCTYTILMHIVQHAIDLGIRPSAAAGILAVVGGVSIAGRFLMGVAGDRIGDRQALIICLLILFMALLWLQLASQLWMFYLFGVIYGFAHGGFFALNSPLIARLFGTRSHGLLFGIIIFCSTIGGAIGPVAAGHIFDVTSSYKIVFLSLAALCTLAIALTATLKPVTNDE
jgi:MFS family permease